MATPVLHQAPLPLVASEFCSSSVGRPSSRRQRSRDTTEVSPAPGRPGQPRTAGRGLRFRFPVMPDGPANAENGLQVVVGTGQVGCPRGGQKKRAGNLLEPCHYQDRCEAASKPESRTIRSRAGRDGGSPSPSERPWRCLRGVALHGETFGSQ